MIKKLAIILSLMLLQGISGTAFAGLFADVPVDNWAYNAVNYIVK